MISTTVCIDSSARRPNHTSYTDETTSVSNYRRSGKYPRMSETVSEKCPARGPRGVREGSGRGPGGVREGSGRGPGGAREGVRKGSGRGPRSARNGSEVVLCPNRAREFKKVCEPLEECTDFWPELTNYHQCLAILQTSNFRAQGQWF